MQPPRLRSRATRRFAATLAVALIPLAAAPAALAHATIVSTSPENNEVVDVSPARVTITFSEPVETAFGAVRVFNNAEERVDKGALDRPASDSVAIALEDLPNGTYTVTWRVVSADAHPIQGAFVFHVGAASANSGGVAGSVLGSGTPASTARAYDVARFLGFAALFLAAGGSLALLLLLRDAQQPVRRKLWYVVAGAAGALALLGPVTIVLQGAAAEGFTVGQALHWSITSEVLGTKFGHLIVVRTILAAALFAFALAAPRIPARYRTYEEAALLPAVGLLTIPPLIGHASVSGNASVALDFVHVTAASVWVGGLAFVVLALLLATDGRWPLAMRCVPRFSEAAVISVAALIVAGTLNGYLQIRTWDGLFNTTYGRLLLVKIALVTPLLLIGLVNNRFVPRLKAGDSSVGERQRFLRMTGAELTLMAVIVGVTAVLISEPPAKALASGTAAPKGVATIITGPYHLEVELAPGTAGPNDIVITVVHGDEVTELTVAATLASQEIGPLDYTAKPRGEDTFVVTGADLSIAGDWTFRVSVRQGEFDLYEGEADLTVGRGG